MPIHMGVRWRDEVAMDRIDIEEKVGDPLSIVNVNPS